MAVNRRKFLKAVAGVTALLAAPFLRVFERVAPARWVEAVRARVYPGPLKKIEEAEIAVPGKWKG